MIYVDTNLYYYYYIKRQGVLVGMGKNTIFQFWAETTSRASFISPLTGSCLPPTMIKVFTVTLHSEVSISQPDQETVLNKGHKTLPCRHPPAAPTVAQYPPA